MINKVIKWAKDRNLDTADPEKQLLKLREEYGELNQAIAKNRQEDLEDAIGDMIVVLIILCLQSGAEQIEFSKYMRREFGGNSTNRYLYHIDLAIARLSEYFLNYFLNSETNQLTKQVTDSSNHIVMALEEIAYDNLITAQECLSIAYNEIKNRKGKMVNGVFVKKEDLQDVR